MPPNMLSFQQAKTFLAPTEFQKIMVQFWFSRVYLGTALFTVIGCFTDGKNEHGLKLEKTRPSFNACKNHQKSP